MTYPVHVIGAGLAGVLNATTPFWTVFAANILTRDEKITPARLIGILLGIGSSQLISKLNGWPVLVSTTSVIVAFVFSAAVGMFFGFYPARKAAQLDPIDALRYE